MFTLTREQFLANEKAWFLENESLEDYNHVLPALKSQYLEELLQEVRKGKKITLDVYNNLDTGEQFYFTKHFNAYNDKVVTV